MTRKHKRVDEISEEEEFKQSLLSLVQRVSNRIMDKEP